MTESRFEYVLFIASTQETVWNALLDPGITAKYWQHENVSDWKPGSWWEHRSSEERGVVHMTGQVVECLPPRRLVLTWVEPEDKSRPEK